MEKKYIDNADILKPKQAENVLLVKKGRVHAFYNAPWGLIGMEYPLISIKGYLKNAYSIKKTGEMELNKGHGIVIIPSKKCKQMDLLFVETLDSFNKKSLYEIKNLK